MANAETFTNYSRSSVKFLAELTENNDREWFKANQGRYERVVREPTLAFIRAMAPRLRKLSRQVVASDRKVGGSMMRPQRDTRFATDKTPYKTNVGVQFRHEAGKDVHAPGLYIHFDPGELFIAVGMWHPEAGALSAVRTRISEEPKVWKRVRDDGAFRRHFELRGDSLKRPPKGYAADHPLIEDLKRKDHIAVASLPLSRLFGSNFVDDVDTHFRAAKGYMKFLCGALDLPF
ncbi:MAG: TIGR02453 family protein [Myxococcales bacterium]|nr:TIGR02453 family protein [Myxococcales bacterium]